jgi:hypothetical protein
MGGGRGCVSKLVSARQEWQALESEGKAKGSEKGEERREVLTLQNATVHLGSSQEHRLVICVAHSGGTGTSKVI